MSVDTIIQEFRDKVSENIQLVSEGAECFRVFTPFRFDDGDHIVVVLKKDGERWLLSDEANTYMRLSYEFDERDLWKGTRKKIILNALSTFQIEDRDGELLQYITDQRYGDALYSLVQGILKISDVSYLSRTRVLSTFKEDFQALIQKSVPIDRITFNWIDFNRDPDGCYAIDCRINGLQRPIFVQALANDNSTRDATIILLQFEKWGVPFHSVAIFKDQNSISKKVLARFCNVSEIQFPNLAEIREMIPDYLVQNISI